MRFVLPPGLVALSHRRDIKCGIAATARKPAALKDAVELLIIFADFGVDLEHCGRERVRARPYTKTVAPRQKIQSQCLMVRNGCDWPPVEMKHQHPGRSVDYDDFALLAIGADEPLRIHHSAARNKRKACSIASGRGGAYCYEKA